MRNKHLCALLLLSLLFSTSAFSQKIKITPERNNDNSVTFRYEKNVPGSLTVTVEFSQLSNASLGNYSGVVTNDQGILFVLRPNDKKRSIGFSYRAGSIRGNPSLKADSLFTYALPFIEGDSVMVREIGYAGELWGGEKPNNWKAYRLMPKYNDTICAARKGIVIEVVNEHDTINKSDEVKYSSNTKYNGIKVEHADGTIASYSNFAKNEIFVKEGDVVCPQTRLGLLMKNKEGKKQSLRFAISYLSSKKIELDRKMTDQSHYKYLTPYFLTQEGVLQLEPKRKYAVIISDEILNKEQKKK